MNSNLSSDVPAVYQPENEPAIATFINIPWQSYTTGTTVPVGVAAYHLEGVDSVDFYLDVALEWDLDGSGLVDAADLAILTSNWGNPYDGSHMSALFGEWSVPLGTATEESHGSTGDEDIGYWIDVDIDERFPMGASIIKAYIHSTVGVDLVLEDTVENNVCKLAIITKYMDQETTSGGLLRAGAVPGRFLGSRHDGVDTG